MYPAMKSMLFIGEAYSLVRNAPDLSFETLSVVKSITNESPNIAIPQERFSILKMVMPASGGMLLLTTVIIISITSGNPRQNM